MPEAKNSPNVNQSVWFKGFVLLAIVAAVIVLIATNLGRFAVMLGVLVGLGGMILVHEFGHFLVAKLSGVKVEAFSLGLSPILLGVRRTEAGWRVRVLPQFFRKPEDESGDGLISFTIGRKTRPGDTEYRLGLVPFGGFVGLLGQDDTSSPQKTEDPRAFCNKPISTRTAVIGAGVVMNVLTAMVLFMVVFLIGIEQIPAVVGQTLPGSPAAQAGIQAGDEILEIKGRRNPNLVDVRVIAGLSAQDEPVPLTVRHRNGSVENLELIAKAASDTALKDFGILPASTLTVAAVLAEQLPEQTTALQPGDVIYAVNGQPVHAYWQLQEAISHTLTGSVTLSARRGRSSEQTQEPQLIETTIPLEMPAAAVVEPVCDEDLHHICSMIPRLRIIIVAPLQTHSIKQKIAELLRPQENTDRDAGENSLQAGDIILAIGDVTPPTYLDLRQVTAEYQDKPLSLTVLRKTPDGTEQTHTITVTPRLDPDTGRVLLGIAVALDTEHPVVAKTIRIEPALETLAVPNGATITRVDGIKVNNFYDIIEVVQHNRGQRISIEYRLSDKVAGAVAIQLPEQKDLINTSSALAAPLLFETLTRLCKASGPLDALKMGYRATGQKIAETYLTLRRLIQRNLSPKNLIGPVGIVAFGYRVVSEMGAISYLFFLAWVSVAVAVLNFLPLPVIDGGHIVMLIVEKIKGSPLSPRIQTVWSYTGVTLLAALFLYVTGNDIIRLIVQ
jgi:regulator of sigma E protease